MAGEGILEPVNGWDQRPGALEAMRGIDLPLVAGRREDDGWKVWITAKGIAVSLNPQRARQLAEDILNMVAVIEDNGGLLDGIALLQERKA